MSWWDSVYQGTPPWDVEQPQPVFVELVRKGEVHPGCVLDVGCGSGENALFFAEQGYSTSGIDWAPTAIRLAKHKAIERHLQVTFKAGNALELTSYFPEAFFETVIDSGFFHTLSDNQRPIFVEQLHRILDDGGNYFMLCFSDKERRPGGPRRITRPEIRQTFVTHFTINYIRDASFLSRIHEFGAKAYFTSTTKLLPIP